MRDPATLGTRTGQRATAMLAGVFQIGWVHYGLVDRVTTGHRAEHDRGRDQPPECRGVPSLRLGEGVIIAARDAVMDAAIGVRGGIVTRDVSLPIILLAVALLIGCSTPLYTWDANTTSTARPPAFDIGELSNQPVATIGLIAPGALAGYSTSLSHALVAALADASPPIRGIPAHEITNALNDHGLATEYADLLSGFARNGIMERERLQRIGSALGFRYLLVPGLTEFNQVILDRFEIAGVKVVKTRVTVLRLWLQLWDTWTGHILWESAGVIATTSDVLKQDRIVPVVKSGELLWRRMIQQDLLEGGARSRFSFDK
jgi:hypothetical protein